MPTLAELTQAALSAPVALSVGSAQPSSTVGSGAHPAPTVAFSFPGGGLVPPPAAACPLVPSEPYLTELITSRELASLAAKLVRAKSDDSQSLGRALLHAIRGEPFAPQGQRNKTAFQLSAEIVKEYPNCDPESVLACLSASVSRVQGLGSKLTEQAWLSMIERVQAERRKNLNNVHHVAGKIGRSLRERAAAANLPMPPSTSEIVAAQATSGRASALGPQALNTLFILADGTTYLRRPDETCYRWALKSDRAIAVELANQFGTDNVTVVTHDKGEALPLNELMPVYASNAHAIVHDYASASTTWAPETATLHVGLPDRAPEPEPCDRTHAWLCALAGPGTPEDGESDVRDLYDWIAAGAREHITSPAAGLVIVGEADTGKSVLALAAAATWGAYPVDLSNVVERFNGSLLTSPFWWADERMPDELTDAKYRRIVQERSRLVEPKGREKVELHGCGRIIITLNEPEDLRLGGLEGSSAVGAVVDRIAYFDCTSRTAEIVRALDALRLGPGHARPNDIDLPRVVRHLRWVQENTQPRTQRFLGARADKATAQRLVLQQGVARQNGKALEALIDYLNNPDAWERTYHVEQRQFTTGQRFPAVTQDGWLWVWPQELAARLQLRDQEAAALRRMLKSLRPDGASTHQLTFGNRAIRADYWPVDPEKLATAASVNPGHFAPLVQALATSTRERLPNLV